MTPPTCRTCANWFQSNLPGADERLIKTADLSGACKESPVTVAKGPGDWCRRWSRKDRQG